MCLHEEENVSDGIVPAFDDGNPYFDFQRNCYPEKDCRGCREQPEGSCHCIQGSIRTEFRRICAKKEYRYYISTNEYDPLKSQCIYFYPYSVDINKVNQAIKCFIGTKDFKSLSKGHDKENTVRTIYSFTVKEEKGVYEFSIIGDGFLRNMVRIIMALILKVNENKLTLDNVNEIIESKDRKKAPWTAPAEGLYLYRIYYNK